MAPGKVIHVVFRLVARLGAPGESPDGLGAASGCARSSWTASAHIELRRTPEVFYMFIIGMGAVCNGSSDVILCTRASMQFRFQAKRCSTMESAYSHPADPWISGISHAFVSTRVMCIVTASMQWAATPVGLRVDLQKKRESLS